MLNQNYKKSSKNVLGAQTMSHNTNRENAMEYNGAVVNKNEIKKCHVLLCTYLSPMLFLLKKIVKVLIKNSVVQMNTYVLWLLCFSCGGTKIEAQFRDVIYIHSCVYVYSVALEIPYEHRQVSVTVQR